MLPLRRRTLVLTNGSGEFGHHIRQGNNIEDTLAAAKQVNQIAVVAREYRPGVAHDQTAGGEVGAQ